MEIYVKKYLVFPYFSFFSGFQTWFCQMRWFYPYQRTHFQFRSFAVWCHLYFTSINNRRNDT